MANSSAKDLLENEFRQAIQTLSILLIKGHKHDKKLRAIRAKLYIDLENLESSIVCSGGTLSLYLFRELGL